MMFYLVAVLVYVSRQLTRDVTTTCTWCDNQGGLPVHNFVHWSLHPRPLCFRCTLATFGHEYDIDAPDATSMMAALHVSQPVKHCVQSTAFYSAHCMHRYTGRLHKQCRLTVLHSSLCITCTDTQPDFAYIGTYSLGDNVSVARSQPWSRVFRFPTGFQPTFRFFPPVVLLKILAQRTASEHTKV